MFLAAFIKNLYSFALFILRVCKFIPSNNNCQSKGCINSNESSLYWLFFLFGAYLLLVSGYVKLGH